jgi:phosphatidyl-myo-inositol alpha-mannosyltransferase
MRIAMASEFAYPILGGVSEHVHFLSRELVALGHDVTVVTSNLTRSAGRAAEVDREAERRDGYRTVRMGRSILVVSNGSISRGSGALALKHRMSRTLAGMDVVHAQGLAAPTLGLFALRTSTAPVTVGTFHSYFPEGNYQRLYRLFSPYVGNALARMDRRIAVSRPIIETFEPLFPGGRWEIIPNGVDTELFRPLRPNEPSPAGPPRILFVGRFDPRNALDVLLDAAAILRDQGREFVVQVVGDGPTRPLYERQARRLGLWKRVQWHGLRLDERPARYREATIFAVPCTLASFGVVLLEALASGAPIVAADNIGFRQVLRDDMPGTIVPPRDAPALAAALGALLDDPVRRMEWALRGRALVEARYAWPRVASRIEALYEEILEENGPGRRHAVRSWARVRGGAPPAAAVREPALGRRGVAEE